MATQIDELVRWADLFTVAGFKINQSGKMPDNVFKGMTGVEKFTTGDNLELYDDGGVEIVEPLAYAKNNTFKAYRNYDKFKTEKPEQITAARYQVKQHGGTIQFDGFELECQGGSHGKRSLFKARVELTIMSARDDFSRMLYLNGTGEDGKEFTGLDALVPENGLGDYGGIDSSLAANDWWRPKVDTVGSWDANGDKKLRKILRTASAGRASGKTNLILATEGAYGFVEDKLHKNERMRIDDGLKTLDAGSLALEIAGIPIYFDLNMPADSGGLDQMWGLCTRYFKTKLKKTRNFKITPFQVLPEQDAVIAKVLSMGEWVCNNRRHQWRLKGITA